MREEEDNVIIITLELRGNPIENTEGLWKVCYQTDSNKVWPLLRKQPFNLFKFLPPLQKKPNINSMSLLR